MTKTVVEQEWLAHEITPTGVEIRYGVVPKRMYQIRKGPKGRWKEVPSVTTVLDELKADGLVWWGQRVGIEGTLTLFGMGALRPARAEVGGDVLTVLAHESEGGLKVAGVQQVEDLLKAHRLSCNHVRDQAGDRGQNVHDAFEAWANDPTLIPDPSLFPDTEAGYVAGLRKFIEESKAIPLASEVQVGSAKSGYAGRYDIRFSLAEPVELVVHHTPVRGEKRELFEPGVYLGDLKTSKRAYPKHALQLAAYEAASLECGYEPTRERGVIQVDAEGKYRFVRCKATDKDFLSVLRLWRTMQRSKEWI